MPHTPPPCMQAPQKAPKQAKKLTKVKKGKKDMQVKTAIVNKKVKKKVQNLAKTNIKKKVKKKVKKIVKEAENGMVLRASGTIAEASPHTHWCCTLLTVPLLPLTLGCSVCLQQSIRTSDPH